MTKVNRIKVNRIVAVVIVMLLAGCGHTFTGVEQGIALAPSAPSEVIASIDSEVVYVGRAREAAEFFVVCPAGQDHVFLDAEPPAWLDRSRDRTRKVSCE